MSIVSTLALMATAVVARIKPPDVTRLQAKVDDLTRERDEWRSMAESWRQRAYQNVASVQSQQAMQAQHAQYLNAQSPEQLRMQAQMSNLMNQLDAFVDGAFCNCVPGRHQVLTKR